jgi:hypothetical protein
VNRYCGPLPRKNKRQKYLSKALREDKKYREVLCNIQQIKIGVVLKENCNIPAFVYMEAVPKVWKLL